MTTKEAAILIGLKPKTVALYCKNGTIRAEMRGRDYWITEGAVADFLANRRPAHRPRKQDHETRNR